MLSSVNKVESNNYIKMKIGYLCFQGHLTVGIKEKSLIGNIAKKVPCIHCNQEASVHEEHTLSDNVPAHFKFVKPAIVQNKEQQEYLDRGFLLMELVEDPIITKEFEATKALTRLAQFMLENTSEEERLPDIVDTAIVFMSRYFVSRNAEKNLPTDFDKNLN